MTVSSLYLYNDFVKKINFYTVVYVEKLQTHRRAARIVQWTLIYSSSIFTRCCHFATFTLLLHTHTFFFWGTIWGLVAVCHFNTSAYVSWEQVIFFFNLSTITWETNLTYNSIIKRIVHIQISPVLPWCSYSFIYTYVCVYILYI